jgi:hypothetical protein
MADPNIKQIKLVSSGPQEGGTTRKRSKQPKKKFEMPAITKEGGGSTSPGTMTQLASTRVAPVETPVEPVGMNSALTQKGLPVQAAGAASNPVKVVLGELKKKSKVVLAAAKTKHTPQTRKVKAARKVRVSMVALSRKIGKAKDIRTKASGDKIEDVKKALQKAGLIKAESKAPETMLRQMYADFMMLKKRAL